MTSRTYKKEIEVASAITHDRTLFQQAWVQFKRNKRAMIALGFIVFLFVIVGVTQGIDIFTQNKFYTEHIIRNSLDQKLDGPSWSHLFGCDEFGRDILLRILWGTKYSLFIGVASVLLSILIGGPFGALAGYHGGKLDNVIMRIMDVFMACPFILLAMAIVVTLGPSIENLIIALGVSGMAGFSRICRAAVMTVKDREFIEATRSLGASDFTILMQYILPNAMTPILVQFTLTIGTSILWISGLSYIGLGVQPPIPEWGSILTAAKVYMRDAWHLSFFPGLALVTSVVAFNLFGDGLRDALDPKMKK